jgi:hypothetical protein
VAREITANRPPSNSAGTTSGHGFSQLYSAGIVLVSGCAATSWPPVSDEAAVSCWVEAAETAASKSLSYISRSRSGQSLNAAWPNNSSNSLDKLLM